MAPLTCAALLLIGLATSAVAGPVSFNTNTACVSHCPENSKFGFENGKTYEYGYETEVKTHIPGATEDHSSLHMNAKVKLEVLSRCEMAIVVEDVVLQDVAPGTGRRETIPSNTRFANALERNALRFAFVSGHVESLCPSEGEDTWVLNVKRGILSNFQNSMNDFNTDLRLRETDVTGECPVAYTTQGAGWKGIHTITKTKNIEACQSRMSADTIFQGTAYQTPSKMQSLPVLKGTHECEQKINKQGILIESSCTESHLFRPFAKENSGATTDVKTKLTFKKEKNSISTPEGPVGKSIPITFDHEKTEEELTESMRQAKDVLKDMCAQTTPGVTAQAPGLFGKLVTSLKKLNAEALVALHREVRNGRFCENAEKYIHDAVPTVGTVASARLIKDLILSGEVSGAEETMWLNSLAFVQTPSAAMLGEITPLLTTSPIRRQAALAISSLVNNYCRHHADCSSTREVEAIIAIFGGHLVGGCRKASTEHDVVMMSLKALGNTGHAESIADSINMCIRNTDLDVETRVAAIQAFRRMACTADRSELTNVFENAEIDTELRINAYLSLMACPTEDVLRRVRSRLEVEEINQLGSFVWTHLTNLKETSSPLKQEIRQIVETESLRKEFNVDKRKFSRNIEKSYFSDLMNSGASVESNLIWSGESFVPRSASLNLTADLFGHSINLVEIGGRVEGINNFLDQVFDTNTPADENKETINDINEINNKANIKRETEPKGSAYLRVFGNEISYLDFHDLDAETVREKFNYLNWLIELAKDHRVDFTKSFQFLDTTVTVATIAGFPLRMHIQGNGVTDLKLNGKLDVRSLAAAPRSLAIDGKFAPSAALEITAEMGIDAFATRTGLRTVDTLHTSTEASGRITLREGKIFDMNINMARDRMEVFSAKHDFFVVYREETHEITLTGSKFEYNKCTPAMFSKVTGFEVCGTISVPNAISSPNGPYFPLAAPGTVSILVNKKDTFQTYHFEVKGLRDLVDHEGHRDTVDIARVHFNTPGSRVKREITMDFSLNHSGKKVSASLITPWTQRAVAEGSFISQPEVQRATAMASLGERRYEALAEVKISSNKYNTRYEPKFELTLPSGLKPTVSGSLLYRTGRKIDINMVAENIFSETVNIEGTITGQKQTKKIRYETQLNIKSPIVNGKVDGFIDRTSENGDVYSSRLEVMYKPSGAIRNRLTFSGKVRDKSAGKRTDVTGTMAFTSTLWAKYNTDLKFDVQQQGRTLSTSFEGKLDGSEEKTIKFEQSGTLAIGSYNKKANFEADFKFPYMNMDYNINLNHEHKKDLLKSSAVLTKDGRQHGLFSMDIIRESTSPLKASADIKLHYPGRQMRYTQSIHEVNTQHYRNDLALQLEASQVIHLVADYKMLPRHELEATLTSPFTSPINFVGFLKPVLRDFEGKASLEHSGRQYAAEAMLDIKANEARASMSLIHPRRTITSELELKSAGKTYTGMFDAKWDAARDTDKKVTVNAEITLAKMRPAFNIKAEACHNKFFEIITSGEFLNRAGNIKYQGDFLFKSSIENFEEIQASFKHKWNPSQISASTQLTYAPSQKIDGEFTINLRNGWESVDANAKLTTPFSAVKRVTYELDYAKESNTFRASTKGFFNRHNIAFVASGTATPNLEGSITMTSTFKNFQEITLSGSHVDTGRKCHTDAELTWAKGKKVTMNYNGEHSRSSYYLNSNGDFTVTTPFRGYRSNKITWRHSNDAGSLKHHSEIEIYKQKAAFDFDVSIVSTGPKREFHLKTTLTAPDVDIMVNANHEHSISHARGVKTDATVQWTTGKSIKITQDANVANTGINILTKFTSPFQGFETIIIDLEDSLEDNTLTVKNEISWPGTKLNLDGNMVYRDTEVDGTFELATPYFPKQKFNIVSKQEGGNMIQKRSYQYAPGKVIEWNEVYGFGRTKSYSYEFKSPCQYAELITFDFELEGEPSDFNTKVEFFHNMMSDKVEFTAKASTSDLSDLKVNAALKTPFRPLTFLRTMYSHKMQNDDFTMTGSFQIPSYKATFDHEMTFINWRRFNTKTQLMYKPGEKIAFTTRLNAGRKIAAVITLKTPFENAEEITATFNHEGPLSNMKTSAELSLANNKKINAEFEFTSTEGVHTFITLTTPFSGYKNLGLNFNLIQGKMDWSMNIENYRLAGMHSYSLNSNGFTTRHSMQTPFQGFENVLFTFKQSGDITDFKQESLFELRGRKYTMNNIFSLQGTKLTAKSEMRTPSREFSVFIAEVNHDGNLRNFQNNAKVTLNEHTYEYESSVKITKRDFELNAKINVPRQFTITLTHDLDSNAGINKVVAIVNGQRISAESTYLNRGQRLEGSLLILTPFEGYEKFHIAGKHTGSWNNFNCEYTLEAFEKKITVTDEFNLRGDHLNVGLNINTPFRQLRNFGIALKHDGPWNDFKNEGSLSINGKSYNTMSEFHIAGTTVSGIATLSTPEEYSITFSHSGPITDFTNNYQIKSNGDVYNGQSAFKLAGGRLDASANVNTPTYQSKKVSLKFKNEGTPSNFEQEIVFTYGTTEYSAKTIYEIEGHDIKANFELKTPFTPVRSFVIDAMHEGKSLKNFRNNIDIILNGEKKSASSEFKWFSNVFKFKFDASIPEEYHVLLKNKGELTDFAASLSITTPTTTVNSNGNFKMTGKDITSSFSVNTPFRHFRSQSITFDFKKIPQGFNAEAKVLTDRPEIKTITIALNHDGTLARFNTNGKLEIDTISMNFIVNHEGHLRDFSSSASVTYGQQTASSQISFKKTNDKIEATASLETPSDRFAATFNHNGDLSAFQTTGKIETPYRNLDFSYNHKGNLRNFECEANIESDGSKFTGVWKFKHIRGDVEFEADIQTPFRGYDRFGVDFKHNSHARGLKTTIQIETPFTGYENLNAELTHDGHSGDFHTAGVINAFRHPLKFDLTHQGERTDFNTNGFIEYGPRKYTMSKSFKVGNGDLMATGSFEMPRYRYAYNLNHKTTGRREFTTEGSIETPHHDFERASFDLRHKGGLNNFETSGKIVPFQGEGSFRVNHRGNMNAFSSSGEANWNSHKVSGKAQHRGNLNDFESSAEAAFNNHRMSGKCKHSGNFNGFESSAEGEFDSHRITGNCKHHGNRNDFETSAEATFNNHKISGDITHKGDLTYCDTSVNAAMNGHTFSGNVKKSGNLNNFEGSVDAAWGTHNLAGHIKHKVNSRGFLTIADAEFCAHKIATKVEHSGSFNDFQSSAEASYNDHKVSGNVQHRGNMNDFTSSGELKYNSHKLVANMNHRGNLNAFSSSANGEYNGDKMNGNMEFKNENGNIETSATVETPFTGYERFHAFAKHSMEGKKMKTEAKLETPFKSIRDPSFDIQHRGHWKNFKTTATLVSPFKTIKPVTISANHRGIFKDFTSSADLDYGKDKYTGSASYKRTPTSVVASANIGTPFEEAKKFGVDIEYSYDGQTFNTKGNVETPHGKYNVFGAEIHHEGDSSKFETTGKINIETPIFETLTFTLNHEGHISNFKTSGNIAFDGQKRFEGEASYKKTAGYFEADHDAFIRVATPYIHLRNAELNIHQAHNDGVWSGNVKGAYNGDNFDGDYSLSNKARKSASVTIREPRPMEYTSFIHPAEGKAEAFINWDSRSSDSQMRYEVTWKNVNNRYNTDRQVVVKVTCHSHTRSLSTGYTLTQEKFETKTTFEWDQKFETELEVSKSSRGRTTIYDFMTKTTSPVANFVIRGNHNVNPSRRYLTEINFGDRDALQIRSDIKTPKGDFSDYTMSYQISDPRLTKPIVIGVEGKIDPVNTLYDGKIDLEYAAEKIIFTGKISDESNRYKTKWIVESSLQHPSNDVDISFKSNLLASKKEFKTEGEFKYMMSRTRQMKTMATTISFDKIREEVKIQVSSPLKSLDWTARRTVNQAARQHFSVSGTIDEHTVQAEVDVDNTVPGIDMTLEYAPEKTLHMFGKYLSPDHFQINAYRQESGRKIPEVTFDTEIVAGNLIKGRAFLRPSLFSDVSDLFSTESGLGRLYSQVTEAISKDLRLKTPGFKRAAEPVVDAVESLTNDFARFAVRCERYFNAMYKRNDYYTRDLAHNIARFFRTVRSGMDETVAAASEAITRMEGVYRLSAAKYNEWRLSTVRAYNRFYTEATAKMTELRKTLQDKINAHVDMAQANLLDLVNYIRTHPRVQALFDRIQAKAERIVARIDELTERCYDAAVEFLNRPEMEYVKRYINNANSKVAWVREYINLEERAHDFIHKLKETGFSPLRRTIWRTVRDYFHFDETKITTWAPERGEVAGQVYIPATMRDLRSMPTIKITGYFDDLKRFIPDTNWVFWDTLYAYKPSSDIRDWIPPFKSHATISGTQHYMTFDKRFFEFAGECSYLLANDMIDNTFSVVVNYNNKGGEVSKKSITVVHGKDTVEILPDFRVEVNGRRSEMPVISQHTAVYRVGNTLRIDNDHGVKVACNLPQDHCTVSVTGWYFSKTGGLFGTYDNEPATDFKKPSGEMTTSTEELASSWTVGKQCRATNRAVQNEVSSMNVNYQKCNVLFQEESSAFRPCFKQVDPTAFMKMCMNGDVCKVASFYVHECSILEVPIRMPRECVTCQLPNGQRLSEGQEETLTDKSDKADVVFVVSHGDCNQEAVEKINTLAGQILKGMKEIKVRNVRFGIVGYGGEGREAEPHSHTMDGQLLNSKTTFIQTINNFRTMGSEGDEDSFAAIKFAAKYPFRAGASKSIVLIPCQKCEAKQTPYSTIQEVLSEMDIRFHLLIHQDFELRASTKSPKTSYMFGLDRESVYTNKDVGASDIRGDKDLRRHTIAPKDLCVALSHETDGSVFNIRKLTQTKSVGQKRFADVFSRVVAKKGTPSDCQVCECRSDETGVGISVCRSCDPITPHVYSWDHLDGLPEPELLIPKKGRSPRRA